MVRLPCTIGVRSLLNYGDCCTEALSATHAGLSTTTVSQSKDIRRWSPMQPAQKTPQHKRPIWAGSLLAILAPGISITVWGLLKAMPLGEGDLFGISAVVFLFSVPVSAVAYLFFGLPYILWLRSIGRMSVLTVCLGAMAIGAVTWWLLLGASRFGPFILGAGFGLVSSIGFCIGSGPNKSFEPKLLRSGNGVAD